MKNYLTGTDILGAELTSVGDDAGGMGGMGGGMGWGGLISSLVNTGTSIYSQQKAKSDADNAIRSAQDKQQSALAAEAAAAKVAAKRPVVKQDTSKQAALAAAQERLAKVQAAQAKFDEAHAVKPVEQPKKPFFKTGGGIAVIVSLSVVGLGGVGFAVYKGLKR
jgi:hypothetical protein